MSSVLIALDGKRIRRSELNVAYDYCLEMRLNVEVLLVDGGEEKPEPLADFLARLKQAGLDVRLYRKSGPFNRAVQAHADGNKHVYVILLDSMKSWGTGIPFRAIQQPIGVLSGAWAHDRASQGIG